MTITGPRSDTPPAPVDHVLEVTHHGNDLFRVSVRDHVVVVDQPLEDGGGDEAPTPTELFVASLSSCVAFYARRYLTRHGLPTAGLRVSTAWSTADHPARVARIDLRVTLPDGVPADRYAGLAAVVARCTVGNTLRHPPTVDIQLASAGAAG